MAGGVWEVSSCVLPVVCCENRSKEGDAVGNT